MRGKMYRAYGFSCFLLGASVSSFGRRFAAVLSTPESQWPAEGFQLGMCCWSQVRLVAGSRRPGCGSDRRRGWPRDLCFLYRRERGRAESRSRLDSDLWGRPVRPSKGFLTSPGLGRLPCSAALRNQRTACFLVACDFVFWIALKIAKAECVLRCRVALLRHLSKLLRRMRFRPLGRAELLEKRSRQPAVESTPARSASARDCDSGACSESTEPSGIREP